MSGAGGQGAGQNHNNPNGYNGSFTPVGRYPMPSVRGPNVRISILTTRTSRTLRSLPCLAPSVTLAPHPSPLEVHLHPVTEASEHITTTIMADTGLPVSRICLRLVVCTPAT